jgi:two-component system chemotaxis response regulator CheY
MIVDDSALMRAFIGRVLRASGFPVDEVVEAANGEEALDLLRTRPVDLVLTDINMPGMDGEQLLRALELDRELRQIPVVVVSTDSSRSRVDRMLALGARGYLGKPFHPEALRAELEGIFGGAPEGDASHV